MDIDISLPQLRYPDMPTCIYIFITRHRPRLSNGRTACNTHSLIHARIPPCYRPYNSRCISACPISAATLGPRIIFYSAFVAFCGARWQPLCPAAFTLCRTVSRERFVRGFVAPVFGRVKRERERVGEREKDACHRAPYVVTFVA